MTTPMFVALLGIIAWAPNMDPYTSTDHGRRTADDGGDLESPTRTERL
jgi:hypothetical protein